MFPNGSAIRPLPAHRDRVRGFTAQAAATRAWLKISASAESSGRVNESFLNGERRRKTAEQFAKEFECGFASPHRNVFEEEWLERRFVGDIPMFDECSRADLRYAQQLVGHAQLIIEKNGTGQVVDEMLAAGTGHDVKKLDYS